MSQNKSIVSENHISAISEAAGVTGLIIFGGKPEGKKYEVLRNGLSTGISTPELAQSYADTFGGLTQIARNLVRELEPKAS